MTKTNEDRTARNAATIAFTMVRSSGSSRTNRTMRDKRKSLNKRRAPVGGALKASEVRVSTTGIRRVSNNMSTTNKRSNLNQISLKQSTFCSNAPKRTLISKEKNAKN